MSFKNLKRFVVIGFVFFISCKKDKPEETLQPQPVITNSGGVYIINEGNFQFGNSKVSYYNPTNSMVTEDLFQPANNRPLGDICQSIYSFNAKTYVVVNNSGKIEVVNPQSFVASATISGFTSPRYFLPVSNNKAYVTDLYSKKISVVDLTTNTISGSISCTGWTEEMTLVYGKVYVTNMYSDKVYVINTVADSIIDSITVSYASNSIREDKNGKLWVLCSGNQTLNIFPALHRINPITNQVELSLAFPNLTDSPRQLDINGTNDALYYLKSDGVCRMPITSMSLPSSPLIAMGNYNFYGLGVDPGNETIYVGDAIDYIQNGVVLRYQSNGTFINSFTVGINPSDFYFK